MDAAQLRALIESVRAGTCSVEEAFDRLRGFPVEELGFASVDHARSARSGYPEVVFCAGKSHQQVIAIADAVLRRSGRVLLTRVGDDLLAKLSAHLPEGQVHREARIFHVDRHALEPVGLVTVVSAGTGDLPVAEEAAVTAAALGSRVERVYDVGVAGVHRVLGHREKIERANAVVVVAGMEGALPSLIAGLISRPVIAVPTSIGYGAAFQGLAALLGMLTGCAGGVTVVNIDNGFGGGYAAALINRLVTGAPGRDDTRAASGRDREEDAAHRLEGDA